MDEIEDFIIDKPYELTEEDKKAIHKASPKKKDDSHWKKACLSGFKTRFRDYMKPKQNYCCAFCRLDLHSNEATPEIEHIVGKDDFPDWMYEPFNLCLSCKLCNTKKSTKKVLVDESVTRLPHDSSAYLIVHPYLDKYSDYIEIVGNVLYRGKDGIRGKGYNTIEKYALDRYEVALARAMQYILYNGVGNEYTKFLILVEAPENKKLIREEKFEDFQKELKERIQVYLKRQAKKL